MPIAFSRKGPRDNKLHQALGDIQYVLNKNPPAILPAAARDLFNTGPHPAQTGTQWRSGGRFAQGHRFTAGVSACVCPIERVLLANWPERQGHFDTGKRRGAQRRPRNAAQAAGKTWQTLQGHPWQRDPQKSGRRFTRPRPGFIYCYPTAVQIPHAPIQGTTTDGGDKNDSAMPSNTQQDIKGSETVPPKNPENPYCRFCP